MCPPSQRSHQRISCGYIPVLHEKYQGWAESKNKETTNKRPFIFSNCHQVLSLIRCLAKGNSADKPQIKQTKTNVSFNQKNLTELHCDEIILSTCQQVLSLGGVQANDNTADGSHIKQTSLLV